MPNFGAVALGLFALGRKKIKTKRVDWEAYSKWYEELTGILMSFDPDESVTFGNEWTTDGEVGTDVMQGGFTSAWIPNRFIIEE